MNYPKYVETDTRELVIFPASLSHAGIAMQLQGPLLSAGNVCANRAGTGKFFGESVSTGLSCDSALTWNQRNWFAGKRDRVWLFATDAGLLATLGVADIQNAPLQTVEGFLMPMPQSADAQELSFYFGP